MSDGEPRPAPALALVASRSLRLGPASPMARFVRQFEPYFREILKPELHILEGTYRSLLRCGLLHGYPEVTPLPPGGRGGLVALSEQVVSGLADGRRFDAVVYLSDPRDATSLFPDSLALKRECVVTRTPFLATETAAAEWFGLHWLIAGGNACERLHTDAAGLPGLDVGPGADAIALIAHDTLKEEMLAFAADHRGFLSRFSERLGTGTTGSLLNGRAPDRLGEPPASLRAMLERMRASASPSGDWVQGMASGPKGGDVQIAEQVRRQRCRTVIFFEDPHVSREHEADIQLMERATRIPGREAICLHDPETARRWAGAWEQVAQSGRRGWIALSDAYRRLWGVELIAAETVGQAGTGAALQRVASWYLRDLLVQRAAVLNERGETLQVAVGGGRRVGALIEAIAALPDELDALEAAIGPLSAALAPRQYRRLVNARFTPVPAAGPTDEGWSSAERNAGHLAFALGGTVESGREQAARSLQPLPGADATLPFWSDAELFIAACEGPGDGEQGDSAGTLNGMPLTASALAAGDSDVWSPYRRLASRGGMIAVAEPGRQVAPAVKALLAEGLVSTLCLEAMAAREVLTGGAEAAATTS